MKIRAAHLSYNAEKKNDANFSKTRKMKTKLNLWQTRDVTLFGKSVLAKTLGASQLIYTASLLNDCARCSKMRVSKPPLLVFVEK